MKPLTEKIIFKHNKEGKTQEFIIRKKDYGVAVFFDVFFEDIFLFSFAEDGVVLIENWNIAQREPISLDEDTFGKIRNFIKQGAAKEKVV